MALSYLSNNVIEGLVTDTKPTTNVTIGTIFIETNYIYRRAFRWTGTSWVPLSENTYDALRNKTCTGEYFIMNGNYGSGLFESVTALFGAGSTGFSNDNTDGHNRYYGTGTSGAGAKNGRASNTDAWRRKWKPRIYFTSKVFSSTTNAATFIGFASVSNGTNLHATAPLPSQHGIGIAMLTNQANFQIVHNDGDASATLINTGVAKDNVPRSCEIWTDDTNWYVAFEGDTTGVRTISTNIPAQTQALYATWGILTNDTTDRFLYLYKMVGQTSNSP
jgi:hypothetical protein